MWKHILTFISKLMEEENKVEEVVEETAPAPAEESAGQPAEPKDFNPEWAAPEAPAE